MHPPSSPEKGVVKARPGGLAPITRLVALSIRLESLQKEGIVKDYADMARLGGVTRARITQIMNLRNLAPAIQEKLLFLSKAEAVGVTERVLRAIAGETDWSRQIQMNCTGNRGKCPEPYARHCAGCVVRGPHER